MGESVRAICNDPEMPASATVYRWVVSNAEFGEMYARARDAQADSLFDEAGDVARQALAGAVDPQAARLFVDTVKWQAMKLKPRKYGDKLEVEQNLSVRSVTLADELEAITQRQRRMAAEAAAKTTIIDGTCRVIDPHQRA